MSILKTIPSSHPEKGLDELKKQIKYGRDLIARGDWGGLAKVLNDIKELLVYIDDWRRKLPYEKLPYEREKTKTLLDVINRVISEQIMTDYPDKNFYGYPLAIGGDQKKREALSDSWDLIEVAFDMEKSYAKEEQEEHEGVFDKYSEDA